MAWRNIHKILLLAGTLICIFLFWINIYLGATGVIILAALAMSVFIMEDSRILPEPHGQAWMTMQKKLWLKTREMHRHTGSMSRLSLSTLNSIFLELAADAQHEYPFTRMIGDAKAVVTFDDTKARTRQQNIFPVSAGKRR